MSDSTPAERLIVALENMGHGSTVLNAVQAALAIEPELLPLFRVAYKAADPSLPTVMTWIEPLEELHRAKPELAPYRALVFAAMLDCHNTNLAKPLIVSAAQISAPVQSGVTA